MVERPGGARLLAEARQALGISGHFLGQHFDGHIAPEPLVARPIDIAHPARTDVSEELVILQPHPHTNRRHECVALSTKWLQSQARSGRTQGVTRRCCVITGVYSPQSAQRTQRGCGGSGFKKNKIAFLRCPSVISVPSVVIHGCHETRVTQHARLRLRAVPCLQPRCYFAAVPLPPPALMKATMSSETASADGR
jgi:hypothetical protein